jgi:hypothetical protein
VPDFVGPPDKPMSLETKFGTEANNPTYFGAFNEYYNAETNTWATDSLTIAPTELRDDVAAWVIVLSTYDTNYYEWNMNYEANRQVQWRFRLADWILD